MQTSVEHAMAAYYAALAGEYERIYHKPARQNELRTLEAWLGRVFTDRRVLEIACGTGWWTPHGAAHAREWPATDLSPETLAVARAKALPACVRIDADGNGVQRRRLDDGSVHEGLKNCPTFDEARVALGPRARDARRTAHPHYWVLDYRLT